MTTRAYLGLGSNLGDRAGQIGEALRRLQMHPEINVVATSCLYESEPVGNPDQGWFVNAAAAVETSLSARALLEACLQVERDMGRIRHPNERWGPRTLDIDLLLFGNEILQAPDLVVPHPRLHERAFVLVPLLEIAAELKHPLLKKSIHQLHFELAAPEEVVLLGTR